MSGCVSETNAITVHMKTYEQRYKCDGVGLKMNINFKRMVGRDGFIGCCQTTAWSGSTPNAASYHDRYSPEDR